MNSKTIANGILRAVSILLGVLLLLFFLYKIQSVIVYIVIAAILSLIGRPLILFLRKRLKMPNVFAVITTMILMLGLLVGIITLFIPLIMEQGKSLSLLHIEKLEQNLEDIFNEIYIYFSSKGIDLIDELKHLDITSQFKTIPSLLNTLLETLGSFSIGLFSVLFITFFFMKDSRLLKNGLLTIIPSNTEIGRAHV